MEIASSLSASALFRGVLPETVSLAARSGAVSFRKGEEIPSGTLGLVLSGCVHAVGAAQERTPLLNTFREGDAFGVASLFGGVCGATCLKAAGDCQLLLLTQETLDALIASDPVFARNYIAFLTGKIRFLNRKIAAFTAGNAEKTLARYLLSLPTDPADKDTVIIPMSLSKLAASLCIARSSLYRAFDDLEKSVLLRRDETRVTLTSREELIALYGGI